jgi:S1-C subfamily serine protease
MREYLRTIIVLTLLPACTLPAASAHANKPQSQNRRTPPVRLEARQIAQRVAPSVVLVAVECRDGSTISFGSGFFVGDRLVATNRHVIECGDGGDIKLAGQDNAYPIVARWVHPDDSLDLALLKVEGAVRPALSLSDGRNVLTASKVYAAGNPKGLEGTFSDGIVSSVRQSDKLIQHTAPISKGSSGGPLLDEYGKVIGINTLSVSEGQNLNFAIPAYYLRTFLELVRGSKVLAEKDGGSSSEATDPPEAKPADPDAPIPAKRAFSGVDLALARKAVDSLRKLRDGWYVVPELQAARFSNTSEWKKDGRNYELYLLEARDAVNNALQIIQDNVFKEELRLAMAVYLDSENIYGKWIKDDRKKYLTVSQIYPYVKKYSLTYQTNQIDTDAVFRIILPIGRKRINRLLSMLGETPDPIPDPAQVIEDKWWIRAAGDGGRPEYYREYLNIYPNGRYAEEARRKIREWELAREEERIREEKGREERRINAEKLKQEQKIEDERFKLEIQDILQQFIEATIKKDEAALAILLDDKFVGREQTYLFDKTVRERNKSDVSLMAGLGSNNSPITHHSIEDFSINGKVVHYTVSYVKKYVKVKTLKGTSWEGKWYNAVTFIKRENQWKVIMWDARLAEPQRYYP